jgi:hypothetical protein
MVEQGSRIITQQFFDSINGSRSSLEFGGHFFILLDVDRSIL